MQTACLLVEDIDRRTKRSPRHRNAVTLAAAMKTDNNSVHTDDVDVGVVAGVGATIGIAFAIKEATK